MRSAFRPARFLALALALAVASGCLGRGSDLGDPRVVRADSKAAFSAAGWAYDGEALESVDATVDATFNDADNAGSAVVTWMVEGQTWKAEFDLFAEAPNRSFMDGGIEFDLTEHGDSGVADASVPKILALVAAWGEARVSVEDVPLKDPTGAETWSAHVMASDTTVRGTDGKIATGAGGAYDPARPGDARRVEGDRQLLFALRPHPREAPLAPFAENFTGDVVPQGETAFPFAAEIGGAIHVEFTAQGAQGAPAGVGQGSLALVSPSGTEVATGAFQVTPAGPATTSLDWLATESGEWTLVVSGEGAFSFLAAASVVYGSSDSFFTLTWDDFEIS